MNPGQMIALSMVFLVPTLFCLCYPRAEWIVALALLSGVVGLGLMVNGFEGLFCLVTFGI